ncbi:glycosyltransferase family 2 protein [Rickettsiales endosymbiont of Stachyamoeba lipophora]|uniref:glycosyltransferase family 2 protein n=1 Tax=Rickettsiales endosymbiont of Stachyamoeba lipophora TaxID=2486578 RepID=UPI000F64D90A|nr:glycosyltransferase family 2 protein [Rickettsiales endosymbiont of Stachyamoeba lipophora]AZL15029.1 glycosyltransferase [Rickettsiales endosymbiont of Stachyamoeba lipophora]
MTQISVIIPIYNEEKNITPLVKKISEALINFSYEIIFINDGSDDNSFEEISKHISHQIKLINFTRNFGQTPALRAGIDHAQGKYIVTMDGDLQNDPFDIPNMLEALLSNQADMVCGIRQKRQDHLILRTVPSSVANFIISAFSRVKVSDLGCALKVFTAKLAKELELYGEMHRFISLLASFKGAKVIKVPVNHYPRLQGKSKYGLSRIPKVISDFLLILFLQKYAQKPMHFFGGIAVYGIGFGLMGLVALLVSKMLCYQIYSNLIIHTVILLFISSLHFIALGFIGELLVRVYFSSPNKRPYEIDNKQTEEDIS